MSMRRWAFFFLGLEGSWGQPQGQNFPSPWATMLALHLDCSTAALTTPQKVLPIWKLVELKMLDFSDRTRTGISILTSAADHRGLSIPLNNFNLLWGKQFESSFWCGSLGPYLWHARILEPGLRTRFEASKFSLAACRVVLYHSYSQNLNSPKKTSHLNESLKKSLKLK